MSSNRTKKYTLTRHDLERFRSNMNHTITESLMSVENLVFSHPNFLKCVDHWFHRGYITHKNKLHLYKTAKTLRRADYYNKFITRQPSWERDRLLLKWYLRVRELYENGITSLNVLDFFSLDNISE